MFYVQKQGTTMGSNMAPTCANIFMANLEEEKVYVFHHFTQVARWWRYIGYIFVICTGTNGELIMFFNFMNSMDSDIKFTLVSSDSELQFLDTRVIRKICGFETDIFIKPTDFNNLLRFDSLSQTLWSSPYHIANSYE